MRNWFCWLALLATFFAAGCFGKKNPSAAGSGLIVSPEQLLSGKVVSANPNLQFAVINFPVGQMPAIGQRLMIFRNGLKVGELRVSGPQRDDNIIADVVTGEAATGDEVRDR